MARENFKSHFKDLLMFSMEKKGFEFVDSLDGLRDIVYFPVLAVVLIFNVIMSFIQRVSWVVLVLVIFTNKYSDSKSRTYRQIAWREK